jgi:FKBP-type peptidyl-prolyl cis-trans isomerase (trigger factor)
VKHTEYGNSLLECTVSYQTPTFAHAKITIPAVLVDDVYNQAVKSYQRTLQTSGFAHAHVPAEYVKQHCKHHLIEHIKEFIYNFFVISFLHNELMRKRIRIVGQPRLSDLFVEPGQDAIYTFELTAFEPIPFLEWKYFSFKAPKRKNYKDLDRQVETFLEEELKNKENYPNDGATVNDWVGASICLVDEQGNQLCSAHNERIWLKIGDEEADEPFRNIFAGQQRGQSFVTNISALQEYFSPSFQSDYQFKVTVEDIIPHQYFCLDQFKKYFKLKTYKELNQKLIEVFSYRNDLSLRRSMVHESLKLMFAKHRFSVPYHAVLRQQQHVVEVIQNNPDYHVYRAQKDFTDRVRELAERQVKEMILLEQLAFGEELESTDVDVRGYLSFLQRPRMKEFLYFDSPVTKVRAQEQPMPDGIIRRRALHEKSLNHLIHHLAKK